MRVHTDERPYVCDHCKESFRHLNSLKWHGDKCLVKNPHLVQVRPKRRSAAKRLINYEYDSGSNPNDEFDSQQGEEKFSKRVSGATEVLSNVGDGDISDKADATESDSSDDRLTERTSKTVNFEKIEPSVHRPKYDQTNDLDGDRLKSVISSKPPACVKTRPKAKQIYTFFDGNDEIGNVCA